MTTVSGLDRWTRHAPRVHTCPCPGKENLAGRIDHRTISSAVLAGNPLGDPAERPLWVYVPPGYEDDPGRRYPSVYVLQGYTGHVAMWANRSAYRLPFPEAADELFASAGAPPCIVVYVDAWTAYGGSQFVDSPGTGPLPHVPVRRGGPLRRFPLPDRRLTQATAASRASQAEGSAP